MTWGRVLLESLFSINILNTFIHFKIFAFNQMLYLNDKFVLFLTKNAFLITEKINKPVLSPVHIKSDNEK